MFIMIRNTIVYRVTLTRLLLKYIKEYFLFFQICMLIAYFKFSILLSGDIETNPGPSNVTNSLKVCHWNLNGVASHNFIKISLIEAYNSSHNFDIICLSETFLNSDYPAEDSCLKLQGYDMIRCDFPGNMKRGGVCMYYKEDLPLMRRDDISPLDQCLVAEIKVKQSKCFVSCIYRSPSLTAVETSQFCQDLETTCSNIALENPVCSFILGDFNAKCTNWWSNGTNNSCGLLLNNLMPTYNYSQVINEPTNFEGQKNPSCIDLIFSNQPNLILESGVHPSLTSYCHHQIIFVKINFKIILPPAYRREIWHFKNARIDLIQQSINRFDWEGALGNLDVNKQVEILTETLLNIFRNFIPNEVITCKSRDPPWMTKEIKKALRRKNRLYKKYISRGMKAEDKILLNEFTSSCFDLISTTKTSYFLNLGNKLNNTSTSPKVYWSILNRLMNKIKIPTIPPLLMNGKLETDFQTKANMFNVFFSNQCTIENNQSSLPSFINKTGLRLPNITFSLDDICKIIKNLNPNKAHGHDGISIKMIQLCGNSLTTPLSIIFQNALASGTFPDSWKKGNVFPVHKKASKQIIGNYRPISLLPIFGKIFEKIIHFFTFSNFFIILTRINYYLQNNQVFDQEIRALTN